MRAESAKQIVKQRLPENWHQKIIRARIRAHRAVPVVRYQVLRRVAGGPAAGIALLHRETPVTADSIIRAHAYGIFPIPQQDGSAKWHDPDPRVTIPIDFHVGKRLKSYVRKEMFDITFDQDFAGVLAGCAETKPGRNQTWLTPAVRDVYRELHDIGAAHSVEAWKDGRLVGGVMGISIGAFFATESLFYREDQASKVAYTHLCASLKRGGYQLHDMQMESGVSRQFGQVLLPRDEYRKRLAEAIVARATFEQVPPREVIEDL